MKKRGRLPIAFSKQLLRRRQNEGGATMNENQPNRPVDPWVHRSVRTSCLTCMWFVPKAPSENLGRCRRRAPTMSGFPVVFVSDWCGDHKLDEGKV